MRENKTTSMKNRAYIDGQNLHFALKEAEWEIDFSRFRTYLKEKYKVQYAYYFMGYKIDDNSNLYIALQKAGFILVFKEHAPQQGSKKKGNVDTDLVFQSMKDFVEESNSFDKVILVSGDGDYKKLVDFLIKKRRFAKILFPTYRNRSSLYQKLGSEFFDCLENNNVKPTIERKRLNQ